MPSPFPGMDPYIESPALWSDFHNILLLNPAQLNRRIQPRYFARLTPYVTYEVVEVGQVYGVRPDVGVWHLQPLPGSRKLTSPPWRRPVESLVALQIPCAYTGRDSYHCCPTLVTVIEILSPVTSGRAMKRI